MHTLRNTLTPLTMFLQKIQLRVFFRTSTNVCKHAVTLLIRFSLEVLDRTKANQTFIRFHSLSYLLPLIYLQKRSIIFSLSFMLLNGNDMCFVRLSTNPLGLSPGCNAINDKKRKNHWVAENFIILAICVYDFDSEGNKRGDDKIRRYRLFSWGL